MPTITADGYEPFEVPEGTRLVRALLDNGVDILHRCGGFARCTTCRVTFSDGEPTAMTEAEYAKLNERELLGQVRLSCQVECQHDMALTVGMTLADSGLSDAGPAPEPTITPEPVWRQEP